MSVNVLIFTDFSSVPFARAAGGYRIATELRKHGYTVQVVDHFMAAGFDLATQIIDKFVGDDTLIVGFATTFMSTSLSYMNTFRNNPGFTPAGATDRFKPSKLKQVYGPVVGARGVPLSVDDLGKLRDLIKQKNPKIKLIAGGTSTEWINEQQHIDAIFKGMSDASIIEYIRYLEGKNPFFQYTVNSNGSITVIESGLTTFDFQNSTIEYHSSDLIQPDDPLTIEIARGCIFRCKFCSYKLNGKTKFDYIKNNDVLYSEFMNNYARWGTTHYVFADDTFNDSVYKLDQFAELTSRLPFKLKYAAYLRHDLINRFPEMADLLKDSGLRSAVFGIETLNHSAGKIIGKGLAPDRTRSLLQWLRDDKGWKNNILMYSGFILGLPTDTPDTVIKWGMELLDESYPLDSMMFNPLVINRSGSRTTQSEFEMDYEKYGYRFPEEVHSIQWETDDWSYKKAVNLANDLNDYAALKKRCKVTGFHPVMLPQYGMPWDEMSTLPRADLYAKYPFSELEYEKTLAYFRELLKN